MLDCLKKWQDHSHCCFGLEPSYVSLVTSWICPILQIFILESFWLLSSLSQVSFHSSNKVNQPSSWLSSKTLSLQKPLLLEKDRKKKLTLRLLLLEILLKSKEEITCQLIAESLNAMRWKSIMLLWQENQKIWLENLIKLLTILLKPRILLSLEPNALKELVLELYLKQEITPLLDRSPVLLRVQNQSRLH